MLGSLRLLLALAVAASHVDYRIAGLNPGVSAVVGFYLISGYVMAGLLQRHYPTRRRRRASMPTGRCASCRSTSSTPC